MKEKYGIILVDPTEIVIRIYETDDKEWKLLHYHDNSFDKIQTLEAVDIARVIAEFLSTEAAQHVIEWKVCAKQLSQPLIHQISSITGLPIEILTKIREQELLCKGIFTEL